MTRVQHQHINILENISTWPEYPTKPDGGSSNERTAKREWHAAMEIIILIHWDHHQSRVRRKPYIHWSRLPMHTQFHYVHPKMYAAFHFLFSGKPYSRMVIGNHFETHLFERECFQSLPLISMYASVMQSR